MQRRTRLATLLVRQMRLSSRKRVNASESLSIKLEAGLGRIMAAQELADLRGEPSVQLGHQRRAEFLADREPLGQALAVDAALDVKLGVETLHGFERDRVDHGGALAVALLACGAYDIGQLEELAPRMGKATRFRHRTGVAAFAIESVVAAIGISLQDFGPCREMGLWVLAAPVARVKEQRCRRTGPGKGAVSAHIDP